MCKIERYGCMDSAAVNYDSHATVNVGCYASVDACFDNEAINFNCTATGFDNADGTQHTTYTEACTTTGTGGTTHFGSICTFADTQTGKQDVGGDNVASMDTEIPVAESIDWFTNEVLDEILAKFLEAIGVEAQGTTVSAKVGSTILVFVTPVSGSGQYNSLSDNILSTFSSLSAINSALGVTALSLPTIK